MRLDEGLASLDGVEGIDAEFRTSDVCHEEMERDDGSAGVSSPVESGALDEAPTNLQKNIVTGGQIILIEYATECSLDTLKGENIMSTLLNHGDLVVEADDLELDDIKNKYPASGRKAVITHFQDFSRARAALDIPPDEEPYRPFYCRNDFKFARIAMDVALKADHVNVLIKLITSIKAGEEFTITGHGDLMQTWKEASDLLTPVSQIDFDRFS